MVNVEILATNANAMTDDPRTVHLELVGKVDIQVDLTRLFRETDVIDLPKHLEAVLQGVKHLDAAPGMPLYPSHPIKGQYANEVERCIKRQPHLHNAHGTPHEEHLLRCFHTVRIQ